MSDTITPEEISAYRTDKSLTQRQLADLIGVNTTTATTWEKGQRPSGAAEKLLLYLIKGIHPFNKMSGDHGANWDLKFSLNEFKELERRRIAHGFAQIEDYLAWVVRQELSQRPKSGSSDRKGSRKKPE